MFKRFFLCAFVVMFLASCSVTHIYKPDASTAPQMTFNEAKDTVLESLNKAYVYFFSKQYGYSTLKSLNITEKELKINFLSHGAWVRKERELTCSLDSLLPDVYLTAGVYYVDFGPACGVEFRFRKKDEQAAKDLASGLYNLKRHARQSAK